MRRKRRRSFCRGLRAMLGREYCVSEINSLLGRWGATDEETRTEIINKLIEERFIDEARYCRAFARDHFRYSQWGRVKITMVLKAKKISRLSILHQDWKPLTRRNILLSSGR